MDAAEFLGLEPTHNPHRFYLPVDAGIATGGQFLFGGCGLGAAIVAMERVLVVSDVPPLREIVTPGETGLLFRPEDAADLATVLEGLLDDATLRDRLGRQAREWVAAERTWAENGRRYRALYERLGAA